MSDNTKTKRDWRATSYGCLASAGFLMSGLASLNRNSQGPVWPGHGIYAVAAMAAGVTTMIYAVTWSATVRRVTVAMVVVAAAMRAFGWAITFERPIWFRVGAVGSLFVIIALILLLNVAARKDLK